MPDNRHSKWLTAIIVQIGIATGRPKASSEGRLGVFLVWPSCLDRGWFHLLHAGDLWLFSGTKKAVLLYQYLLN